MIKPCKLGHVRRNKYGACMDCAAESARKYYKNNPGLNAAKCKARYNNNKEYYFLRNQRWMREHPSSRAAWQASRRAVQKNAQPKWVDISFMKIIYKFCPKGFHVDHIVPLQGKNVCGLHVPHNLQYLAARENFVKNNRFVQEIT